MIDRELIQARLDEALAALGRLRQWFKAWQGEPLAMTDQNRQRPLDVLRDLEDRLNEIHEELARRGHEA